MAVLSGIYGYEVDVVVSRVPDDEFGSRWAAGFYLVLNGVEYGWNLGMWDTEDEAEKQAYTAILSAMRRVFPPEVGTETG